jgi:SAM-dependent methyltransferase
MNGVVRAVTETFTLPEPILEVGSFQVAGQEKYADLRQFFPGARYWGVDQRPGPGVDETASVEALPFSEGSFGTVLALNLFEHVPRFWRGFQEVHRVLRSDGVLLVSAPFNCHIHAYPSDYWRFTREGLGVLLEDYPCQILGQQGPKRKPVNVWAVAFREDYPLPTRDQFEGYRARLARHAREPLPWSRRLRYLAGRCLFGRRPFANYLERERWETEWRTPLLPSSR